MPPQSKTQNPKSEGRFSEAYMAEIYALRDWLILRIGGPEYKPLRNSEISDPPMPYRLVMDVAFTYFLVRRRYELSTNQACNGLCAALRQLGKLIESEG